MDTGSLRRATGPPWSGARVGVGMLRGAGDTLLEYFLDSEIYQDSTVVQLGFIRKKPRRSRSIWTHAKFKNIHQKIDLFNHMFDWIRCAYVFVPRDSQNFDFIIWNLRNVQESTVLNYSSPKNLGVADRFGTHAKSQNTQKYWKIFHGFFKIMFDLLMCSHFGLTRIFIFITFRFPRNIKNPQL